MSRSKKHEYHFRITIAILSRVTDINVKATCGGVELTANYQVKGRNRIQNVHEPETSTWNFPEIRHTFAFMIEPLGILRAI